MSPVASAPAIKPMPKPCLGCRTGRVIEDGTIRLAATLNAKIGEIAFGLDHVLVLIQVIRDSAHDLT
jgi:hypothetical protein